MASGSQWYAAPDGSVSGDGGINDPWDLQTALNQPAVVRPGDTIWLRGGVYKGSFTSKLKGAAGSPVVVRQYPGERAVIDRAEQRLLPPALEISGAWAWYWGFEVMNSAADRNIQTAGSNPDNGRATGVNLTGKHLKLINMIVHDNGNGVGFFMEAQDSEIYGCLIYHNGWMAPDRGHGHGIYTQNHTGTKAITDNIFFSGFNHGLHAYASGDGAYVDNFEVQGNTAFNSGILQGDYERNYLIGNGITCANNTIAENYAYFPPGINVQALNLGYARGCQDATLTGNYLVGNVTLANNQNLKMSANTYIGGLSFDLQNTPGNSLASYPGNTQMPRNSRLSGTKAFIRPNLYEAGRANAIVYNWDRLDAVEVDLSGVLNPGDKYEIRDAQNFLGDPLVQATYGGGPVAIPMTSTAVAAPVAFDPPAHTDREFGVFVIVPSATAAPDNSPPVIGDVAVASVNCYGAVITWSTGKLADGRIQYTAPDGVPLLSPRDAAWTTRHAVTLAGLAPGTEYSFEVRSSDPGGNAAVSPVFTFTTPDLSANQAPLVEAGPSLEVVYPAFAALNGSASDDGLPAGSLQAEWRQVSGPGTASFTAASSPATTAAFSAPGTYVLRLSATDGALDAGAELTAAVNDAGPGAPATIRVNCGGPAYTDNEGRVWSEDTGFQGGAVYSAETGAPALYLTVRYGAQRYRFDVADGLYLVRLKFAEIYFNAPGARVFNVAINGRTVLANFDVFAAAGAPMTACDKQFEVRAAGGGIEIEFSPVVENPFIAAIEILPSNPLP